MLRIEINEGGGGGADITILGIDLPEPPEDEVKFLKWRERRDNLINGIHALLVNLGPIPENGWQVEYRILESEAFPW